ncbi:MAG: hypothetical protein KGY74_06600, partial [Candidatus Cloacimonetes bacterium]|nr:hypothetical protein [Candidatus Cloacimonadota bacterium]
MRALLEDAVRNSKEKISPNVLVALAAVVDKKHTGKGLSFEIVNTMKGLAAKRGLSLLIVPVRPTLKHQYPLIPLPEYADGKRDDGLPFEPWLRVHKKQGG